MGVYEQHSQHMGNVYGEYAATMEECVKVLGSGDKEEKVAAAKILNKCLGELAAMRDIEDLTSIYRSKPEKNAFGYNAPAVMLFVEKLSVRYLGDMDYIRDFLNGIHGQKKIAKVEGLITEVTKLEGTLQTVDEMSDMLNKKLEKESAKDPEIRDSILSQMAAISTEKAKISSRLEEIRDKMQRLLNEA